jgi:MoaA/NifB/PqqE/SkfB family radical SAM enzyme
VPELPATPALVVWDVTYACPLRCVHCYSESGRRPARQLGHADLLRVADAIASLRPMAVAFAGGEPLLIPGLAEVAERLRRTGAKVSLYTSGWRLTPAQVEMMERVLDIVHVSVDGATAAVNDRIRGRAGAYDRAMAALGLLDAAAARHRAAGRTGLEFGIDYVVTRGNVGEVERFCREVLPRFPRLHSVSFGAAVPSGLASRPGFVEHELLDDAQCDLLTDPAYLGRLRSLAPAGIAVLAIDNRILAVHPDAVAQGRVLPLMQVEPDGGVRAMAIYEGTVGNLLTDPPEQVWRRAVQRWSDPVVVAALEPARTMRQWAEALRELDHHFGTDDDRARIDRRPAYQP